jgi:hypothetical protein
MGDTILEEVEWGSNGEMEGVARETPGCETIRRRG